MASKATTPSAPTSEYPKPLVRLRPAVGGYDAEVRMAADADEERVATADGFQVVAVSAPADFREYPKWLYHADGRSVIVQSQAEAETLDGFAETPVAPEPAPAPAPAAAPAPAKGTGGTGTKA